MPPCLPHDLLWVAPGALQTDGVWPQWADAAWRHGAPVVVRREAVGADLVPVGLRGTARSQRARAYVAASAVTRRVTPEMLRVDAAEGDVTSVPALAALAMLTPRLNALGLAWGPTGGAGFFLASGLPVLRPDSDLDLLVRAPRPLSADQTVALDGIQGGPDAACRIDIQVDTGHGAFALAEWRRGGRVLLKTNTGPLLCTDPWMAAA
ncbi:MAG: malonate decarboxylase holo-ACP synthase [Burkholderiaceae bacterium]|nr:malonate decarboxylase holo-ACP synthase [Burkholderiaceae bacterium]